MTNLTIFFGERLKAAYRAFVSCRLWSSERWLGITDLPEQWRCLEVVEAHEGDLVHYHGRFQAREYTENALKSDKQHL